MRLSIADPPLGQCPLGTQTLTPGPRASGRALAAAGPVLWGQEEVLPGEPSRKQKRRQYRQNVLAVEFCPGPFTFHCCCARSGSRVCREHTCG